MFINLEKIGIVCFIASRKERKRKSSYLDERHPHSVLLDMIFNGVTHPQDELVRHHEDQDVCSLH